jgi:hypothetical protein
MKRFKQGSKLILLSLFYTEFLSPNPYLLNTLSPYSSFYSFLLTHSPTSSIDWLHSWNKLMIRYKVVRNVDKEANELGFFGEIREQN